MNGGSTTWRVSVKQKANNRRAHPYLVDKLDNDELENLVEGLDLVDATNQVLEGAVLVSMDQHHERIALAGWVLVSKHQNYQYNHQNSLLDWVD